MTKRECKSIFLVLLPFLLSMLPLTGCDRQDLWNWQKYKAEIEVPGVSPEGYAGGNLLVEAKFDHILDIQKVEFIVNDIPVFTDFTSPYQYNFDATSYADGEAVEISITAYNGNNRSIAEESVTIIVDNNAPGDVSLTGAIPGNAFIELSWINPADSDLEEIIVVRNNSAYPATVDDGLVVYRGTGTNFIDMNCVNDQQYYYTIFARDAVPNYSAGTHVALWAGFNGDFEIDAVGTTSNAITWWDEVTSPYYDSVTVHVDSTVNVSDARYMSGSNSLYSYARTSSGQVHNGTDREIYLENSVATDADYFTFWLSGTTYTTPSRYWVRIYIEMTDGVNSTSDIVECHCWGWNEGCTPNNYNYYDEELTGPDGNIWRRYTWPIDASIDKSNLTIRIRHRQVAWDTNVMNSSFYLDYCYFSDAAGNKIN